MHRILHDVPAPIEEVNPEAPTELQATDPALSGEGPKPPARLDANAGARCCARSSTSTTRCRPWQLWQRGFPCTALPRGGACPVRDFRGRGGPGLHRLVGAEAPVARATDGSTLTGMEAAHVHRRCLSAELSADGKTYVLRGNRIPACARHGAGHPRRPGPRDLPHGFYVTAHQWTSRRQRRLCVGFLAGLSPAGHRSSRRMGVAGDHDPRGRARPALARQRDLGLLALGLAKDRLQVDGWWRYVLDASHSPADVDLGLQWSRMARGYSASISG